MEELIRNVISKVTSLYKCDKMYSEIIKTPPKIDVRLNKDYKLELHSISFLGWNNIYVYNNCILYCPRHGKQKELLSYNSWNELLEL